MDWGFLRECPSAEGAKSNSTGCSPVCEKCRKLSAESATSRNSGCEFPGFGEQCASSAFPLNSADEFPKNKIVLAKKNNHLCNLGRYAEEPSGMVSCKVFLHCHNENFFIWGSLDFSEFEFMVIRRIGGWTRAGGWKPPVHWLTTLSANGGNPACAGLEIPKNIHLVFTIYEQALTPPRTHFPIQKSRNILSRRSSVVT